MKNYSRFNVDKTLYEMDNTKVKLGHSIAHFIQMALLILVLCLCLLGAAMGFGMFRGIPRLRAGHRYDPYRSDRLCIEGAGY